MVSFRINLWATYIVFLSNEIFHSQNERRLSARPLPVYNSFRQVFFIFLNENYVLKTTNHLIVTLSCFIKFFCFLKQ